MKERLSAAVGNNMCDKTYITIRKTIKICGYIHA